MRCNNRLSVWESEWEITGYCIVWIIDWLDWSLHPITSNLRQGATLKLRILTLTYLVKIGFNKLYITISFPLIFWDSHWTHLYIFCLPIGSSSKVQLIVSLLNNRWNWVTKELLNVLSIPCIAIPTIVTKLLEASEVEIFELIFLCGWSPSLKRRSICLEEQ